VSDDQFDIWVQRQPAGPGHLGYRNAWLKDGPKVAKTVTYGEFGDPVTRQVKNRELRFRTAPRRPDGYGFDFDDPTRTWACENAEIDKLLAFLQTQVGASGRYRLIDTASPQAALADLLADDGVDVEQLVASLVAGGNAGQLVEALTRSAQGLAAAEAAVLAQRRDLVDRLQQMAADPQTTETDMQRVMEDQYWLFGGRYVGVADRRNLTVRDSFDVPLLGADGTLRIVELKGPNVPGLVRRHRNHWVVGTEVHQACSPWHTSRSMTAG
jgi:hypothetical protein